MARDATPNDKTDERRRNEDTSLVPARRYFDTDFNAYMVPVQPGVCAISTVGDEMLVAVVGSSIAACMYDPVTGIGGMAHFLLPGHEIPSLADPDYNLRYGHYAMEKLVNDLLAAGGQKKNFEIKIYGGAGLLKSKTGIGEDNITFVKNYLEAEGLTLASEDVGGLFPRRIQFVPKTGKVFRLLMRRSDDAGVFMREVDFREQLRHNRVEGAVTLFVDK